MVLVPREILQLILRRRKIQMWNDKLGRLMNQRGLVRVKHSKFPKANQWITHLVVTVNCYELKFVFCSAELNRFVERFDLNTDMILPFGKWEFLMKKMNDDWTEDDGAFYAFQSRMDLLVYEIYAF